MLSSGDTFNIQTQEGPRLATVQRINTAYWRPGTFDKLLVSLDLAGAGNSAVLLLGPDAPAEIRLDAAFVEGRIRLRWPEGAVGSVEVSDTLDASGWTPLEASVSTVEGQRQVEIPTGEGTKFFRFR
jgi:hypothetical protein